MADSLFLPGNILSMAAGAAERLIELNNGDAALLYLVLLKTPGPWIPAKAARMLKWDPGRVAEAYSSLVGIGLAADVQPTQEAKPLSAEPPQYTMDDIIYESKDPNSPFAALCDAADQCLGRKMSPTDLTTLYTIYQSYNMPAEVVMLLINWCGTEWERKYGLTRRPKMPDIRRTAEHWREQGVDTVEAAEAHMKRMETQNTDCRRVMAVLDLRDRAPVEQEQKYISGWLSMGFPDDAIRLAYEKTIMKTQKLHWGYMNSILKRWHGKGLHTLEQIRVGDKTRSSALRQTAAIQTGIPPAAGQAPTGQDDMARIRAYLEKQRKEEQ